MHIVSSTGGQVIIDMLQIIVGCLLSIPFYYVVRSLKPGVNRPFIHNIALIFLASIMGMLLPLGTYGLLPVILTLAASGTGLYLILPAIASNAVFNTGLFLSGSMLPMQTYTGQMLLAFVTGAGLGVMVKLTGAGPADVIRQKNSEEIVLEGISLKQLLKCISGSIQTLGLFLLAGTIANVLFQRYLFKEIMAVIYASPLGNGAALFFLQKNAAISQVFNCVMSIFTMFVNFAFLTSLLAVFRIKAIVICYSYYVVWAVVLTGVFLLIS